MILKMSLINVFEKKT